ncbi:hypothetical protein [Stenotrophomonas sp. ATCM1_4]|uniref:hypothetical protein n=1 Tax=Stenotrophomonas sp. ATCM1_4 TaxID=2259330 RepID=UPI0014051531|nr:hypothetical protein [Stenotrophomonas sp. ATCM1_4]
MDDEKSGIVTGSFATADEKGGIAAGVSGTDDTTHGTSGASGAINAPLWCVA